MKDRPWGEEKTPFPVTCAQLQHPRVLRRRYHHPKTPPPSTKKTSQRTLKPSPGSSSGAGGGSLPPGQPFLERAEAVSVGAARAVADLEVGEEKERGME
jgi:hypothetical protein